MTFITVYSDVDHPEVLSLIRHCASQDTDIIQRIDASMYKIYMYIVHVGKK